MNTTSQIAMNPSSAPSSVGSLLDSSSASANGPSFAGVLEDTAPKITRKGSDSKPDHSPPGGANLPDSGNSQPPPAAQSPPPSAAPPPRDSSTAGAASKADNAVKRSKSAPASATSTLPTADTSPATAGPQTALTAAQSAQVAQVAQDARAAAAAAAGTAGTHLAPATRSTAAAHAVPTNASNSSGMKGEGTAASALPATIKAGANDGAGAGSSSAPDGTANPTPVASDASAAANSTSMSASTDGGFAASLAANGAMAIAPGAKTGAAGRSISPSPVAGLDVLAGTANGSVVSGAGVAGAGAGAVGAMGAAGLGGAGAAGALAAARLAQIQGSARHAADSTGGASFSLDGSGAGAGSGMNATTPGDGSAALAQLTSGSAVNGATDTSSASSAVLRVHANVDSAAFPGALTERVSYMVGHDLSSAKLSVNPPSLGPIEVNISVQGDHAHVSMASHSAVTREALQATAPQLKDMLSTQGFGQVSVDISQRSFQDRSSHAQPYERQSGPLDVSAASTSAVAAASGLATRAASSALDAYA